MKIEVKLLRYNNTGFLQRLTLLIPVFLLIVQAAALADQQSVLAQVAAQLQLLRSEKVHILFPEAYDNLQNQLESLENRAFPTSEESQRAIGLRLIDDIAAWRSIGAKASSEFAQLLALRERCAGLGAAEFAEAMFSTGDRKLQEASEYFYHGDREALVAAAEVSGKSYLQAELKTIRENILGEVRIQLSEAENLNGHRHLPETYGTARQLLKEVEVLQRSSGFSSDLLYQKSQQLVDKTRELLTSLYMVHRFRDDLGAAEKFLIEINGKYEKIAENLDIEFAPGVNVQEKLETILTEVERLKKSDTQLRAENRRLSKNSSEIRNQLLAYQTVSERKDYLKSILDKFGRAVDRPIQRRRNLITVGYDSLKFVDMTGPGLSLSLQELLTPLAEALPQLNASSILVNLNIPRVYSDVEGTAHAQQQALAIQQFLERRSAHIGEIHATGETYAVAPGELSGAANLTITIDIAKLLAGARLEDASEEPATSSLKDAD